MILDSLKFAAVAVDPNSIDAIRARFIDEVSEQIKLIRSATGKEKYLQQRMMKTTDEDGNEVMRMMTNPRVRHWYHSINGQIYIKMSLGHRNFVIDHKTPLIYVEKGIDGVEEVLNTIKRAAEAKELDKALLTHVEGRKRNKK